MDDRKEAMVEDQGKRRMKKTIVFYIATLTRGGAERVIANLANYFYREGYRVYMVTLEPDEGLYPLESGIHKVVLEMKEGGGIAGRGANALRRITQVRSLLKKTKAQTLVSFIGKTNIRAILAALGLPTKVIVSVRSAPEREYAGKFQKTLARFLFCLADGIVFQSEGARAFFPKAAQKKSCILFNPLSPEYRKEPFKGERKNEIVTAGRMDKVKNHRLLVDAFARVEKERPEMRLTIYGDGDCMEAVRKQVKRLGLSAKVNLPGDSRNIAEDMRDARIFVLSSDFEGMPNAIAEAFALGIPVVSTDCPSGGAAALVRDGETGLLVPVRDAEKMAAAILRILNDRELEERLRGNALAFSKSLHADRINGMWKDYIESKK